MDNYTTIHNLGKTIDLDMNHLTKVLFSATSLKVQHWTFSGHVWSMLHEI
jgi:hypothetical protein